jgi:16S rRNA (cytosine967-C5)-methyltransferase
VASVTEPRLIALEILTRVRRGELADRALASTAEGLDHRDHAWLQELVYGTLRLRGRLDHLLAAFVRAGLESLDPLVLDILRLGAYQLLEMGSVPPYAAVSQTVELVRAAGVPRAAGLVNGVLQSLRRGWAGVEFPSFDSSPVDYLTTWGSHPRHLVERWLERFGPEAVRNLIEANNRRGELYLTPVHSSAAEAVERLLALGIGAEGVPGFPDSVRVLPPHTPLEALRAVPAVVQDPAAAMVVRFANIPPGALVLDMSAAPGGKTVGLAAANRTVIAADLSVGRLRRVRSNVERVGVQDHVALVVADGRAAPVRDVDAVLLDAPCSGTGTFRRHADGRWRIMEADIVALARLQAELLDGAAAVVRRDGLLIYATCSLEPEENEQQVEHFLSRHSRFRLVDPEMPIEGTMTNGQFLTILPHLHGVDGAFAARLKRVD